MHVIGDFGSFAVLGCAHNRGVARTAAQISSELCIVVGCTVQVGGRHGHNKAGRAKSALAAMPVDQGFLHGMQGTVRRRHPFDRSNGFSVDLGHKKNAGVQCFCADLVGDHHRTGAAVAFIASFFGSLQALIFAKPIE